MYKGKHNKRKKHANTNKSIILVVYVVLMICLTVGTTVAFLIENSEPIVNTFLPAEVTSEVVEEIRDGVKSNVQIRNTGNIDAYIRAKVIVTWQDSEGNIYGSAPIEGVDYVMNWCVDSGSDSSQSWFKDGEYYYHKKTVDEDPDGSGEELGGVTDILFTSCKPIDNKDSTVPESYTLSVEIIGSAIQSLPEHVVETKWGVTVTGGELSK